MTMKDLPELYQPTSLFGQSRKAKTRKMKKLSWLYHSIKTLFFLSLATTQLTIFGIPCIKRFASSGIAEEKIIERQKGLKPPSVTPCPFKHSQQVGGTQVQMMRSHTRITKATKTQPSFCCFFTKVKMVFVILPRKCGRVNDLTSIMST